MTGTSISLDDCGSTASSAPIFISGVSLPEHTADVAASLAKARQDGFDYVVTSLPNTAPLTSHVAHVGKHRTDVTRVESKWWSTSVVGMVSDPDDGHSASRGFGSAGQSLINSLCRPTTSPEKRRESSRILWGGLEWASHMNIPAVILPSPTDDDSDEDEDMFDAAPCKPTSVANKAASRDYAQLVSAISTSSICTTSHVQLWIRVPLSMQAMQAFQLLLDRCDHSPSIGCMLHMDRNIEPGALPSMASALHAFLGAGNVKAVSWDTGNFLRNKKGFPTLSKSYQHIFSMVYGRLGRTVRTLVEGQLDARSDHGGASSRLHHLQYLRHLRSRAPLPSKLDSEEAVLETPYLDSLQSPLQPLGDHLEYQTYETFEKDPVKYSNYGEAIELALLDGLARGAYPAIKSVFTSLGRLKETSESLRERLEEASCHRDLGAIAEIDVKEVTILVVGAGRGPLVREAIAAVDRVTSISLLGTEGNVALHAKIIAIEKNPSAMLYLQSLRETEPSWNGAYDPGVPDLANGAREIVPGSSRVSVIGCDMREATSHPILRKMIENQQARGDIVVSELLGSFGDNELSPECLDGVQKCGVLKDTCVSIPQSYTAFLAPVSSARLISEAKAQGFHPLNHCDGPGGSMVGVQRALETPYVVRCHAASQTHDEQACWTYTHPHVSKNDADTGKSSAEAAADVHNDRCAHLSFSSDPTNGSRNGCGYGAVNGDIVRAVEGSDIGATLTIHGLLGTFHSVLYESKRTKRTSTISIAPHSFSTGMFSWFPLYFPLKEVLRVPPASTINCSIWRKSDDSRVWYEWCAEVEKSGFILSTCSIHNPGGRAYHVKK